MAKVNDMEENQKTVFDNLKKSAKKLTIFMNVAIICASITFALVILSFQYHSNISPYLILVAVLLMAPSYIFNKKSMQDIFGDKRLFYLFYRTHSTVTKYLNDRNSENTNLILINFNKLKRGLDWWARRKALPEQIEQFESLSDNISEILIPLIKKKKLKELQILLEPLKVIVNQCFENKLDNEVLTKFNTTILNLQPPKKANKITILWQKHKMNILPITYGSGVLVYVLFAHFNPNLQNEIGTDLALILSSMPIFLLIRQRLKPVGSS